MTPRNTRIVPDRNVMIQMSAVKPTGIEPERPWRRPNRVAKSDAPTIAKKPHDRGKPQEDDGEREDGVGGQARSRPCCTCCVPRAVPRARHRCRSAGSRPSCAARAGIDDARASAAFARPPPRHETEVARVGRQLNVGEPRQYPVETKVAKPQPPWLLTADPLSVDDVVTLSVQGEELRNRLRSILKVTVHDYGRIARDMVERRRQRRLMAEVSR